MRPSNNKSKHLLEGMFLLGLAIGAVFVLAIGVDGRFTNNQKVSCLTIVLGVCTIQIMNGLADYDIQAGTNGLCQLVPYPLPLTSTPPHVNVTMSFSQPHLGVMVFPAGELDLKGNNGVNVTDIFALGGTANNPLYVPNTPRYYRFMPENSWVGVATSMFQISMLQYDDNVSDAGTGAANLSLWAQWFPATSSGFQQVSPQVGGQWHNLTRPIIMDNASSIPPPYPIGIFSSLASGQVVSVNTPSLFRIVYANPIASGQAQVESITYSDLKLTNYGTSTLTPNAVFIHQTNMNLCLVGTEENSVAPFEQKVDLQYTMTVSCRFSTFNEGFSGTNHNYVQC